MECYLVDTCTWIEYFHRNESVVRAIDSHTPQSLLVSEITIAELLFGAMHSANPAKHIAEVERLRRIYPVVTISNAIEDYAEIRANLVSRGLKVGDMDIFIGATARHHHLTVVTDNIRHFELMPDVKVDNWVNR